ncbi:hypothetical protein [Paraliomyxa miuraensis]|uniref:hypothetical protein n=1 Tax=Paraliomyxa miuraensis TaxID=376150 RepID=UPI002255A2DC|nr:hypothetical protein [Paraliomyxa miuraensis]MCX4247785.1 hypothetical protein [Paraliomyxa miuraensis]
MAAEDILEALAARQALESTPEPWLEAARGAISVEEAARRVEADEDPELIERSKLLFRPGDDAVDEQRLERLLREGFSPPSRRPRWWWRGTMTVGLALAAALVLVVAIPWRETTPLPSYEPEFEGTARLDRAAEPSATEVARFYADRRFRATLRPWTAVPGRVEAAVYACEDDGPRPLPVVPRAEPSGIVVIESEVAALGLSVGIEELLFVVGTADALPRPITCDVDERELGAGVRLLRTRIEILPPPR